MVDQKRPEVKTVDLDAEKVQDLLTIAGTATGFPKYVSIREAVERQLHKIEQDLEEKLKKVHEDEEKEKAEAEAKAAAEKAKAAKPAEEDKDEQPKRKII